MMERCRPLAGCAKFREERGRWRVHFIKESCVSGHMRRMGYQVTGLGGVHETWSLVERDCRTFLAVMGVMVGKLTCSSIRMEHCR